MKTIIMIRHLLLAAVLCITTTGNFAHAAEATLKALIIDGQNNHDWVKTTPVLKEMLEKCGRFTVEVATSPQGKADEAAWAAYKPAFDKYDVVVSNYNGRAWAEPTKAAFLKYVADGGGVVMIHAANNAFQGWTEYDKMIGLGWRDANYGEGIIVDADGKVVRRPKGQGPGAGHGAKYPFLVTTRDAEHPVMKGLPKAWMHAEDELYHGQRGPAENMTVLATAMSDKTKGGTGDNEPMIWVIPYGKGRVFTTVMGHRWGGDASAPAVDCAGFQAIVCRGSEWAATGKVTLPVQANFPTAEKTSSLAK